MTHHSLLIWKKSSNQHISSSVNNFNKIFQNLKSWWKCVWYCGIIEGKRELPKVAKFADPLKMANMQQSLMI